MSVALLPNEIHLWFVFTEQIQNENLMGRYKQLLSKTEMEKYGRFVFEKDRQQYLITRALIRSVLSMYIEQVSPEQWTFCENDYGKPEVTAELLPFPLKFNLSHTHNMVALAVMKGQEVGIDVEYLHRDIATDSLAKYAFSEFEYKQLMKLDKLKFNERFFELWTLKEAYIKACGMGLKIPLNSFSFSFSKQNKVSVQFDLGRDDDPWGWNFWQFKPANEFAVSLATKSRDPNVEHSLSLRELIPLERNMEVVYKQY